MTGDNFTHECISGWQKKKGTPGSQAEEGRAAWYFPVLQEARQPSPSPYPPSSNLLLLLDTLEEACVEQGRGIVPLLGKTLGKKYGGENLK